MKLILDKNYIQEVEEFNKDEKNGVKYIGRDLKGNIIELSDRESDKIAPIVRYLAEGKKKKISWLLIIGAGVLFVLIFVIMVILFYPKSTAPVEPKTQTITPETKIIAPEKEKTFENQINTNTGIIIIDELKNEVDMMTGLKQEAENETLRLTYELEKVNIEKEKLTNMVNNLQKELTILNTRKSKGATDDFIFYLGDTLYKRCEDPKTDTVLKVCEKLYYNFLKYGENR